ncbi:hypothetical protein NLU13_7867 [Sarocladium strictum]|uniref:Uncharacterized protein n=1 Tax=Sarocladium strictum TaxID=5046 RepID=A0AA39GE64_SARSR|nr:hypothetical protein NLU13_7867 [Sarocladium strictum]
MSRKAVFTKNAPPPSPHLSQAIICNGMVYSSGALGVNPGMGKLTGNAYEQTKQALNNLKAILEEAGSQAENVVKANIFLSSMNHYASVNKAYLEFFSWDPKPSRTCVAVAQLPLKGADVEIEVIASLKQGPKARL